MYNKSISVITLAPIDSDPVRGSMHSFHSRVGNYIVGY